MANKTQKTTASVKKFLDSITDDTQREDCKTICALMTEITNEKPVMWGKSIVGFGDYHYTYASGREGDWMIVAFSPRKNSISLYIMDGLAKHKKLMQRFGKYTHGKSCISIKSLADIDVSTLKKLIERSYENMKSGEMPEYGEC